MSKNRLIRVIQTIIVMLVGCVSPSYAQTLFVDKPKRCKDCKWGCCKMTVCAVKVTRATEGVYDVDPETCGYYTRKRWAIRRQK